MSNKSYTQSGVDTEAADAWVERIQGLSAPDARIKSGIGDYAAVYELRSDDWIAATTDGVGTKLLWTLEGLGSIESLAQDLVAMNVNDLLCVGAHPLLFLDYLAVSSREMLKSGGLLEGFVKGLVAACRDSQMLLVGGETAQMPDLYQKGHFDCAGFALGRLSPQDHLTNQGIRAGAQLWGWRSSGPHSNGFSLLRKVFDSKRDAAFIQSHLMAPTELYVKPFLKLRNLMPVQSAFHMTGSGWLNLVRDQKWVSQSQLGFDLGGAWVQQTPQWVEQLAQRSDQTLEQLATSFNMGFGFVVVLDEALAESHKRALNSLNLHRIGTVVDRPGLRWGPHELL